MRLHAVMILVAGCLLAADKPKKGDAGKKEQKKLQGTWKLTRGITDGKPVSEKVIKELRLVFRANTIRIVRRDKTEREYTYTLDPGQNPKQITVTRTDPEGEGDKGLGIYKLTEDTLEICMDNRGKKRPKDFTAKGEGLALLVLKKPEE